MNNTIDLQGHRGCRGLYPENTIPAFEHAIDIGIKTLELDVVISKDKEVIISHEPFFNHEISIGPGHHEIIESEERAHNLYQLTYAEIKTYDVGSKLHPKFPLQKKINAHKPSLGDMVNFIEQKVKTEGKEKPQYNIEIKRTPEGDNLFHPTYTEFVDLVIHKITELGIMDRTTVQCFDVESLQYLHIAYPKARLVYLIGNLNPIQENMDTLGFKPYIYSPHYKLVSERMIRYCKSENILVIPWTVNEKEDLAKMMRLGVDGIISDYPDVMLEVYKEVSAID